MVAAMTIIYYKQISPDRLIALTAHFNTVFTIFSDDIQSEL